MKYLIGLDIGTSSTKAIALDLKGEIIGEHKIAYSIINPAPSYFEQDTKALFTAVLQCIAHVADTVKKNYANPLLLGVGFSSAMHGLIAMDKDGNTLTNCIIWADTRSESFADKIKGTPLGHEIYMSTGTPIHPMSPLCKLGWMKDNMPSIFKSAAKYISVKEYVFYKLFGKYVIDESIASATGLFNIHTKQWHLPSLQLAHISPSQLSDIVPITYSLSGMDQAFAKEMHIPADTPFVIGGSDGCLSNLGINAIKAGNAAVTIGTSGAIRVTSGHAKTDHKERTFSYMLTESMFIIGGAVNNGGVILSWFKDKILALNQPEDEQYDYITAQASSVPVGSEGLIFLPYLMGERAPYWNADAKGLFFGLQIHHTKAHFTRAVMEGILFGIYSVGKALEEITGTINVIYANGGFAQSTFWVQMLADLFNKKVTVPDSIESSATGAVIIAMKALNIIKDFDEVEKFIPIRASYLPNEANHTIYMKNFEIFERLYDRVKDEF